MKFGPVSLEGAEGHILAHNISDDEGRRVLRKGKILDAEGIRALRRLGYEEVFVAELEDGDVHEDEAAARVAASAAGDGVEVAPPHTGRVNLKAEERGVLAVDRVALERLNRVEGFTVATLPDRTVVRSGDRVATIKIIPYSVPEEAVSRAESCAAERPILSLRPIAPQPVGIVLVGSRGVWEALADGLGSAIRARVEGLGCTVSGMSFAPMEVAAVAGALAEQAASGARLLVVAGETAIMDPDDVIPRGVRKAGGRVEHLGLAVDPGHLLLLAYLDGVPVVGAPGCVRSPSPDGFDMVLPRLLSGELLARDDLQSLGHGGLLSDPRRR